MRINSKWNLWVVTISLIITVATTFINSAVEEWFYFFREELLISIFLCLLILFLLFFTKHKREITITRIDCLILAYYIYMLFNLTVLNKAFIDSNEFLSFTLLIIMYFILKQYFNHLQTNKELLKKMIVISITGFIMLPFLMIIFSLFGLKYGSNNGFIYYGGIHNTGATANYLVSLAPFSFSLLLSDNKNSKMINALIWITLTATVVFFLYSKSRTALIACIVSFGYLIYLKGNIQGFLRKIINTQRRYYFLIFFIFLLLSFSFFTLYHLKKDSADGRVFIWKNCLQLAKEKPLLGHGIYSFTKEYNEQQINYFRQNPDDTKNGMLCDDALFAFNDYLQIATESGCIGLALFLLIVFFVFTARNKEEGSHADSIFTGSKACIISILVCALFSYPLQMVQIYFIFIFSIAYITSKTKPIFHIEGFASKLIIILIILFVLSTEIFQVKKFLACTKWKKAYTCSMKNQFSESELIYEDAYPVLKTDPFFLFNYGSTLTKINECDKSITMLNKVTDYRTFYDLFLNLGHAYENVHNDSLAEQSYQNAASLIPHMYTPRYYLFKLYKRSGQGNKATEMAREISEMKTKVYSHTVGHIKNEAIDYLKKEELKSGNYNNDQTKHKLL